VSRYRFIAAEKAYHSVVLTCRVLSVAKSAFYAWQKQQLSARARADEQLGQDIQEIYEASRCTYGAPRVHAELRNRGKRVGRKRVARLMRTAGLVGRTPRHFRRTTIPDPSTQVQDLVRRQFDPTEPNQLWLSDITYIRTWEGWLYLAVVLDAYSRKVVGWALADHMRTELATAALQMALISRQPAPGLVCHSDRGSQYTSAAYRDLLEQHGSPTKYRSARDVLGQRGRGVILCHLEKRTDLRTRVAHSSICTLSHIRVHRRLVQPYPPPLDTELR